MLYILYFLIAIGSTTVGALTGMGGGVIIKPVLDVLGTFDASTIGVLSSGTVFAMALVSIGKQLQAKTRIPFRTAVPLALGSVAGGQVGQDMLSVLTSGYENRLVTAAQNIVLSVLILAVYLYMRNKSRIPTHHWDRTVPALLVGVFLGICSSFLGIGGGPINVALIIYCFSYGTKTATVCSLLTIFFAQISKLVSVFLTTGFAVYDLSMLPVMVVGAVSGGFLGAVLNKKMTTEGVERAFNAIQLLVLAIAVFNVARSLMG